MKKITIMIPTYNQAQYIEQCVESAMIQDYQNLEIIISDDSTNDETEKIIREKYLHDFRIKYFRNEIRLGRVGNYHHTLYEKATGDYVLNLDGDDYLIDPTYISEAAKVLDENDSVVCVMAKIQYFIESEDILQDGSGFDELPEIANGLDYLLQFTSGKTVFNHLSALYRSEDAKKIGFYSKDFIFTDSHSIFRLISNKNIAFIDKHIGVWRMHSSNESSAYYKNMTNEELFENIEELRLYFLSNTIAEEEKIDAIRMACKRRLSYEYGVYNVKNGHIRKLFEFWFFLLLNHRSIFFYNFSDITIWLIKTLGNRIKNTFKGNK
jgi:glycosyltransferase involved in cell wall biosynthesis